ncbi:MAG TPA: hypothetical protein VF173_35600 [Thermoanaerobaculia bacterium]|nr:hypothetical protein [Thermoanaerobaculia bacterium]
MITKQEARQVVKKFKMEERKGPHLFYKLVWKEKIILTTAIPHGKGPLTVEDKFRNQLRLNRNQLDKAVECPFRLPEFIAHLKAIGKIPEDDKDED